MDIPKTLTIKNVKKAYKEGLTPEELIQEIIHRTEIYGDNPIFIWKPSMDWIRTYIDSLPEDDGALPLWGIPFAIKDNIDLAGVPTTAACPAYRYIPKKSAAVVEKLIRAGAIPIGKTNLDQFATGLVGTRSPYGEVHNAWQPEMISGGSSSGSAVSVALGLSAFALGTDTAGSGRVPAMLNSLVGWKPAVGAWSSSGVVPACESLDCVTVFAHSLDEAEQVDSIARGYDPECKWSREIGWGEKSLPKKILIPSSEPRFYGDHEDLYRQKWNNCIARIKKLPISVETVDTELFEKAALILYEGAYVAERWEALGDFVESHPGKTFPVTETILRSGDKLENTAAQLFRDLHSLQEYRHEASYILHDAVLVLPTAGGSFTREEVRKDPIQTNSLMGLYTNHCNLLDLSAIALPENSRDHLYPFGITMFSLSDSTGRLSQTAHAFLSQE